MALLSSLLMRKKVYPSREGYDLYAPYYRLDHSYLDSFDWGTVKRMLSARDLGKILDLGCGDGRTMNRLGAWNSFLVGIDVSRKMLENSRKENSQNPVIQADALYLPFLPASFDTVTAFFLVVHIQEPRYLFSEVHEVLRPEGIFILNNIVQKEAPLLTAGKDRFIVESSYHSDSEIEKIAAKEGFVIQEKKESREHSTKISTAYVFMRI
jgi:ubiquinone/menaquinone biosynthesis C-methylase UbiE